MGRACCAGGKSGLGSNGTLVQLRLIIRRASRGDDFDVKRRNNFLYLLPQGHRSFRRGFGACNRIPKPFDSALRELGSSTREDTADYSYLQ
jgi:hypothetical protein